MLKQLFAPLLIPALFACNQPAKQTETITDSTATDTTVEVTETVKPEQMIVPGASVGHLLLRSEADSAIAVLGRPDGGDAAMGSALMIWNGKDESKGYRTAVFASRNMGGKDEMISRIKQIRVTSPWFRTSEGVAAGQTLQQISEHFKVTPITTYKQLKVYDDVSAGIAFDVDSVTQKCVAILVHPARDTTGAYLNMRE